MSEQTNRTETDKIKKTFPKNKLRKLAQIQTKFKTEIEHFDTSEICTICQYTFNECSSKLALLKCGHYYHERCFVLGIASLEEREWKCLICRKDAVTGEEQDFEHEKGVKDAYGKGYVDGTKQIRCSRCKQLFQKGPKFNAHLKATGHHNGRKYGCRVCKSIFMTHQELMTHIRVHKR